MVTLRQAQGDRLRLCKGSLTTVRAELVEARTEPFPEEEARKMGQAKRWLAVFVLTGVVSGCKAALPESNSPEARLYQQKCSGCHRLYAPGVLTAEMWSFMVARMEEEFRHRGVPPLTEEEKRAILSYLQLHSAKGS